MWTIWVQVALASEPDALREQLAHWVRDAAEVERLAVLVDTEAAAVEKRLAAEGVATAVRREVVANLDEKWRRSLAGNPVALSPRELERQVIGYEAWKAEAFVGAGVFPKRYFGYLDLRADTANEERVLRRVSREAQVSANAWLAEQGDPLRITDAEIAVTFLAEFGALALGDDTASLKRGFHPVLDVGLDDLAIGDHTVESLRDRLDRDLKVDLKGLVGWLESETGAVESRVPNEERWLNSPHGDAFPRPYLRRYMTFDEAVVGTTLMWVYEKQLAAKLLGDERPKLHERPLDEQFLIGSLVYNSGLVHSAATRKAMLAYDTDALLYERSEVNAHRRPRLPVPAPKDAVSTLVAGYPEQPTSWVGVYHVMQRYGGYVGLHRFADVFAEDDSFLPDPPAPDPSWFPDVPVAPAEVPVAVEAPPPAEGSGGCGCDQSAGTLFPLAFLIALLRRQRARAVCEDRRQAR